MSHIPKVHTPRSFDWHTPPLETHQTLTPILRCGWQVLENNVFDLLLFHWGKRMYLERSSCRNGLISVSNSYADAEDVAWNKEPQNNVRGGQQEGGQQQQKKVGR